MMWGMMGESQCVLGSVGHPVRRRIHATTVAGFPTLRHSQARGREPRPRWSLAHLGCPYTRPLPEDEEGGEVDRDVCGLPGLIFTQRMREAV